MNPLDPAIYQALFAIPPALLALRDLLRRSGVAGEAIEQIQSIETSLRQFSKLGDWLLEAKAYHERLTQLDLAYDRLRAEVELPSARGGFDPDMFNVADTRKQWRALRNSMLGGLLVFFQKLEHLAECPLKVNADGIAGDGPDYALKFFHIAQRIDTLFKEYTKSPEQKLAICDSIEALFDHTKEQIFYIDDEIIAKAKSLGEALISLKSKILASVASGFAATLATRLSAPSRLSRARPPAVRHSRPFAINAGRDPNSSKLASPACRSLAVDRLPDVAAERHT